ncbi:hypothetical protein [Brevibacterium litoralis]|uniref:hypothetical protein n=1 Tax=Brevibacterium litoralis TaxID=3138935 RepID=UPI0032EBF9FB
MPISLIILGVGTVFAGWRVVKSLWIVLVRNPRRVGWTAVEGRIVDEVSDHRATVGSTKPLRLDPERPDEAVVHQPRRDVRALLGAVVFLVFWLLVCSMLINGFGGPGGFGFGRSEGFGWFGDMWENIRRIGSTEVF